jgi:O-antigen ligase
MAVLAASTFCSSSLMALPATLGLTSFFLMLIAMGVVASGAALPPTATFNLWPGLFIALALAGIASVLVGVVQVFAPQWADGEWIARSGITGRAVGNLRQPNHLSTLLLWSAVAVVPLFDSATLAKQAVCVAAALLFSFMLFGVVLSGSRTGLVGVVILLLWGLADRRLSRFSRVLLIASPLICAASWGFLSLWSSMHGMQTLGAATRLDDSGDISSFRFAIWHNTLELIRTHPWFGVGFGEFNFAWTLTPFPDRPPQFFDHTHNLPLQLLVELGVPLGLLVLGLFAWALWQAFRRSTGVEGPQGVSYRAAFVMVLLMALHSQLEYPLWYAYFLLPTAFVWGLCLGAGNTPEQALAPRPSRWLQAGGVAMMLAAVLMVWDYKRVVAIFTPPVDSTASLADRIVEGRHSWFFAHHADYALVTTIDGAGTLPGAFKRAPHFLLDTRLMTAWAEALAAQGDVERARYLAARLREFRNPNSKEFFAPCDDAAVLDKPFQCTPPTRAFTWRDFR